MALGPGAPSEGDGVFLWLLGFWLFCFSPKDRSITGPQVTRLGDLVFSYESEVGTWELGD